MDIKFTEENLHNLEEYKKRYPEKQALIMPALWMIQEQYGWVSVESVEYLSKILGIPHETIYGVLNFYTMYNKKQVGKYHIQVCTNVSCMLRGAYDILNHIEYKLNLKKGETSEDMMYTISEAECLGSCGTAPMIQLNDDYEENLNIESVDKLLKKLSNT